MGAIIWRPLRRAERPAIVVGFAVFVAYFIALALARSVGAVLWAQILRAIGIGLVTYLGISFLHSFMPHRAGAAAALFSNAGQLGSVFAALSVGVLAQAFGYAVRLCRLRDSHAPRVSSRFASRPPRRNDLPRHRVRPPQARVRTCRELSRAVRSVKMYLSTTLQRVLTIAT